MDADFVVERVEGVVQPKLARMLPLSASMVQEAHIQSM
jgi:hypothetical protein